MVLSNCSGVCCSREGVTDQKENFRRLLRTVETLSDLGPEMTAERDFITLTEVTVAPLTGGPSERHPYLTVARRHIVFAVAAPEEDGSEGEADE